MRKRLLIGGSVLAVLIAGAFGAWSWREQEASARPAAGELHTFLHINCKNHNHGPAWHKNHGRTLGVERRSE